MYYVKLEAIELMRLVRRFHILDQEPDLDKIFDEMVEEEKSEEEFVFEEEI